MQVLMFFMCLCCLFFLVFFMFFLDFSGDSSCRVIFLVFRFLIVFLFFFCFYFFAKSTFSVLHGVISLAMMGTDDQRYLPQDRHAWIRTCPKKGHPGHPQIRSEMWWLSPFWIIPTHFDMISSSQNHHFPPETTKSPSPSFPHLDHNLRGNARCTSPWI